jgi:hypothetical protein
LGEEVETGWREDTPTWEKVLRLVRRKILLPGRRCWGWLEGGSSYLEEGVEAG